MKLNQKGFSTVAILSVVAVTTLVGFVGWRMYSTNQDTTNIVATDATSNTQAASDAQTLETNTNDEIIATPKNHVDIETLGITIDTTNFDGDLSVSAGEFGVSISEQGFIDTIGSDARIIDGSNASACGSILSLKRYSYSEVLENQDHPILQLNLDADGNPESNQLKKISNDIYIYVSGAQASCIAWDGEITPQIQSQLDLESETRLRLNTLLLDMEVYSLIR